MEKRLYPFQFLSLEAEQKPWGSEIYKIADLGFADSLIKSGWLGGNTLSELMQTYLDRVVGETSFAWYGTQFPVMVKFMDVTGRTSLHANADDEAASQRYDAFGKTALWYVAEAKPGAVLYLGFRRAVTASEFYAKCQDGTVAELLHTVHPQKGECYLIPPGLVHGAAYGVKLIEVAESSELFFRLYDWKRKEEREMHLEEAFDLIDFGAYAGNGAQDFSAGEPHSHTHITEKIAETPQFSVTRIRLTDPLHIYAERFESFLLYVCAEGRASLQAPADTAETEQYMIEAGEVLLVPAEVEDLILAPRSTGTVLLEIRMEKRQIDDSYIGSEAEPYPEYGESHCGHHHGE